MGCEIINAESVFLTPFRQPDGSLRLVKGAISSSDHVIVEGDINVGTREEVLFARAFHGLTSNLSLVDVPREILDAALAFMPKLPIYRAAMHACMSEGFEKVGSAYRKERDKIRSYLEGERSKTLNPLGGIIVGNNYRWPAKQIPFRIAANLPRPNRVHEAIAHWNSVTNIRFVEWRPPLADCVEFVDGGECSSYYGRRGGFQPIVVGGMCSAGNVKHEIGHAVGLFHEHMRNDRDRYIDVRLNNIKPTARSNYVTYSNAGSDTGSYDFGSIMHYPKSVPEHAIDTKQPVIVPKISPEPDIGQRDALSAGDISAVRTMYS